ncbi:MAG TPA: M28 family metallopeptidase [Chryseosolibacter sp.]|nr:M28 family metallopeptidase [Chryseosolibacter sp.]
MITSRRIFFIIVALMITSCNQHEYVHDDGLNEITLEGMEEHVKVLASDDFEGRKPFTEGEKKTLEYLESQFREMGLEPGNGDSYLQEVPMVEITPTVDSIMQVKAGRKSLSLRGFHDYVISSARTDSAITWENVPLVFAGFGVVAPEYNWNDYEGLDVKDKIVVVLVNDPGFGGNDTTFFKGNTMTYYGRWTYKFEEAARQGAKGCLVVHNTVPAGYPFQVLQNTWNSAHLYLDPRGKDTYVCEGTGWIAKPAIEKVFAAVGLDFNAAQSEARQRGFKGKPLGATIDLSMRLDVKFDKTYNVIAKITGKQRPEEYIVYTAHWDHLGIARKDASGDSIYNGALDNASGTAGLLEIAKAFKNMDNAPSRSLVFLAVTAEEQGLWGSAWYAENPVYPKEQTVANINMDGINPYGKMNDVMVVGSGQSEMEDYLREEASKLGRVVLPDDEAEKGYYFRSDHFNFARIGVPALYLKTGSDFVGKGKEHGQALKTAYTQKYYHQPSDEFDTTRMNFEGGVEDLKLLFQVGKRLAFDEAWPSWKEGSEFKAVRERYRPTRD